MFYIYGVKYPLCSHFCQNNKCKLSVLSERGDIKENRVFLLIMKGPFESNEVYLPIRFAGEEKESNSEKRISSEETLENLRCILNPKKSKFNGR